MCRLVNRKSSSSLRVCSNLQVSIYKGRAAGHNPPQGNLGGLYGRTSVWGRLRRLRWVRLGPSHDPCARDCPFPPQHDVRTCAHCTLVWLRLVVENTVLYLVWYRNTAESCKAHCTAYGTEGTAPPSQQPQHERERERAHARGNERGRSRTLLSVVPPGALPTCGDILFLRTA